jgi:hypothetical protein
MKRFNITYISPITGRQTMELEVSADRLFDRDGETWFRYDVTPFYNGEEEVMRVVEVITATLCDTTAKAAYMERFGTASE